jgi:hypothetical protein
MWQKIRDAKKQVTIQPFLKIDPLSSNMSDQD